MLELQGRDSPLPGMVREGLPENVIFEPRLNGWEGTSHRKIWRRKRLLRRGTSQCKGTVVGETSVFKEQKEAGQ